MLERKLIHLMARKETEMTRQASLSRAVSSDLKHPSKSHLLKVSALPHRSKLRTKPVQHAQVYNILHCGGPDESLREVSIKMGCCDSTWYIVTFLSAFSFLECHTRYSVEHIVCVCVCVHMSVCVCLCVSNLI